MAYEKYIKRNGKSYGPYLYHSKRVDNKVVSEYYGHKKKVNYKKIFIVISFLLVLFFFIYGFNYAKPYFSGKAVFNINAAYEGGQPFQGILELSLKQGEMIPSSTRLIFNNNGNVLEYPLGQFVLEEDIVEGDYYIQEKNISGKGEGYGIPGEKIIHPLVYFSLDILSSTSSDGTIENTSIEASPTEETPSPEQVSPAGETPTEASPPTEETPSLEQILPTEETPSPEQVSPAGETPTEASSPTEETPPLEQSAPANAKKEEVTDKDTKEKSSGNSEDKKNSKSSLTGNVISVFFRGISNFFLSLTGTGKVTMNIQKVIEANVSSESSSFVYDLQDMETAELKKGSVYVIDSEGKEKKVDDSFISVNIANGEVIVTTDYSELEEGFGKEYVGGKQKVIYLNLSSLDVIFENGNLSIDLFYEGEEIVSLVTSLEQGEIKTNVPLPESLPVNQTAILNETNQTLEITMNFVSSENLSEEERAKLFDYFGNFSISTQKSEIFNGRFIRSYRLGDYEVEYSYDYGGEITSEINEQMQRDLMKWLRDILREISKEKVPSEPIESLIGNYSI